MIAFKGYAGRDFLANDELATIETLIREQGILLPGTNLLPSNFRDLTPEHNTIVLLANLAHICFLQTRTLTWRLEETKLGAPSQQNPPLDQHIRNVRILSDMLHNTPNRLVQYGVENENTLHDTRVVLWEATEQIRQYTDGWVIEKP